MAELLKTVRALRVCDGFHFAWQLLSSSYSVQKKAPSTASSQLGGVSVACG